MLKEILITLPIPTVGAVIAMLVLLFVAIKDISDLYRVDPTARYKKAKNELRDAEANYSAAEDRLIKARREEDRLRNEYLKFIGYGGQND